LRDLRFNLLKIFCTTILFISVCIATSFIFYWVGKAFFNVEYNVLGIFVVLTVFACVFVIPFLIPKRPFAQRERKWRVWIDSKLSGYRLRTRYVLRKFLVRLGAVFSLGDLVVISLIQLTLQEGKQAQPYVLLPLFFGIFLSFIGLLVISDIDTSLLHFRKFREDEVKFFEDFRVGLKNYNRAVGFSFERTKLSVIIQYVEYIYQLNLKEEIYKFETHLDKVISALKERNLAEIPKVLAKVSKESDEFVERYRSIGIKIKTPFWTRMKEIMASSFRDVLPKLLWALIVIAVFLILSMFFSIDISMPI